MDKRFLTILGTLLLGAALSAAPARPDTMRVLCIGNSFTEDAVEQNLH